VGLPEAQLRPRWPAAKGIYMADHSNAHRNSSTRAPLRIALAGLGTVGAGVIKLVEANAELIARRAGRPVKITAISARDRGKNRGVDISPYAWEDDMTVMAARADVDVVVELVGGSDGPALVLARNAIAQGKALITANKAMIAHHGIALAAAAEAKGVALRFEAAVAGGIPVIKALREGAAANRVERIYGILNGTCNYILSTMTSRASMRRISCPSCRPSLLARRSTLPRWTRAAFPSCWRPTSRRPMRWAMLSA